MTQSPEAETGLFNGIRIFVRFTSLLLWAVTGLLFWIPRLTLSTLWLLLASIGAAITGANLNRQRKQLEAATRLYGDGFRLIQRNLGPSSLAEAEHGGPVITVETVLWETFVSLMFWGAIYVLVIVL
jgi:hypothetical protein